MILSRSSGLFCSLINKIKLSEVFVKKLLNQQLLDLGLVGSRNGARIAQVTLLLSRLFGQDVTVISVLTLDLTCAGEGESLLRRGISFHFGHFSKQLN